MQKLFYGFIFFLVVASLFATKMLIHQKNGTELSIDIQNIESISFSTNTPPSVNMVYIEGGLFSPVAGYNVTLSSFWMSKFAITQKEYLAVIGTNPSWFSDNLERPVERVSWLNAIEFCNRLSIKKDLTPAYSYGSYGTNPDDWPYGWNTGESNHVNVSCNWDANGYRLPTEMEREFSARGGLQAQQAGTFNDNWAGTNIEAELADYAWYKNNSGSTTHPVGGKLPNEIGLFDMSGNVWNWVWDIWDSYPGGNFENPSGPENGTYRVIRGGSWYFSANLSRVSIRNCDYPTNFNSNIGFRICRSVK